MKWLFIRSPGPPVAVLEKGAQGWGSVSSFEGSGRPPHLGAGRPRRKRNRDLVLGTQLWESLRVPDLPKLTPSPCASTCPFPPLPTPLPGRLPFRGHAPLPAGSVSSHSKRSRILTQGEWSRAWAASQPGHLLAEPFTL